MACVAEFFGGPHDGKTYMFIEDTPPESMTVYGPPLEPDTDTPIYEGLVRQNPQGAYWCEQSGSRWVMRYRDMK